MLACFYAFTVSVVLTLTATESFTLSSNFWKPFGASLRGDWTCQMRTPPGFGHHQSTNNYQRVSSSSTRLHLLDGIFGSDKKVDGDDLAAYKISIKGGGGGDGSNTVGAVTEYVIQWAHLFEGPGGIHLTTPARVQPTSTGVQILFQKGNTGYADKDKKGDDNKDGEETASKQTKKNAKQGGVEVVVEVDDKDSGSVRVVARRCDMEEDTMIKEMSEATILHELQEAINVWKKNHSN